MKTCSSHICTLLVGLISAALFLVVSIFVLSEAQAGQNSTGTSPYLDWPDYETYSEGAARKMREVAQSRQVVYTELADYLVKRFDLSEKPGIGIDITGSMQILTHGARSRSL